MRIEIPCDCGARISASPNQAGNTVACQACGESRRVPAMGVLEPPRGSANSTSVPAMRRLVSVPALASACVLGVVAAIGVYAFTRPSEPTKTAAKIVARQAEAPIVQRNEPPPERTTEPNLPAIDPTRSEPNRPETPVIVPVEVPAKPLIPKTAAEPEAKKVILPVVPKPALPAIPAPAVQRNRKVEQEIIVTQKPAYRIQGSVVRSLLQYRIVSDLEFIEKQGEAMALEQTAKDAKIVQADDLTRGLLAESVKQLNGKKFNWRIDDNGLATRIVGDGNKLQVLAQGGLGGASLQLASLLDDDTGTRTHSNRRNEVARESPKRTNLVPSAHASMGPARKLARAGELPMRRDAERRATKIVCEANGLSASRRRRERPRFPRRRRRLPHASRCRNHLLRRGEGACQRCRGNLPRSGRHADESAESANARRDRGRTALPHDHSVTRHARRPDGSRCLRHRLTLRHRRLFLRQELT
ncbi:MAG: hypothetical protein U0744_08485 [Gemmataceae bacterium]